MSKIKRAVSMYSLQDQYARGKMDLEAIFQYLNEMGAGLEFISDQMMKGTPEPPAEELEKWDQLVAKYKPTLVCNDVFINTGLYRNRELTNKEALELLKKEIRLANRLGFPMIRLVSNTRAEIIEPALQCAIDNNVIMTLEIHAGMSFDDPLTQDFINVMKKLDSPYVGLTVDTGIFCRRHPRVSTAYFMEQGTNQAVVDYVDNIFAQGTDPKRYFKEAEAAGKKFPDELTALFKNDKDFEYAIFCSGYEQSDFSILDDYWKYVKHFHGKIYEMTDEGVEYSIPFDELVQYLDAKGYDGYIATEYEGNRFALQDAYISDRENVTAHQEMLKRYIGQ